MNKKRLPFDTIVKEIKKYNSIVYLRGKINYDSDIDFNLKYNSEKLRDYLLENGFFITIDTINKIQFKRINDSFNYEVLDFEKNDHDGFRQAVVRLLSDQEKYYEMSNNVRKHMVKYCSSEKVIAKELEILTEAANKSGENNE